MRNWGIRCGTWVETMGSGAAKLACQDHRHHPTLLSVSSRSERKWLVSKRCMMCTVPKRGCLCMNMLVLSETSMLQLRAGGGGREGEDIPILVGTQDQDGLEREMLVPALDRDQPDAVVRSASMHSPIFPTAGPCPVRTALCAEIWGSAELTTCCSGPLEGGDQVVPSPHSASEPLDSADPCCRPWSRPCVPAFLKFRPRMLVLLGPLHSLDRFSPRHLIMGGAAVKNVSVA